MDSRLPQQSCLGTRANSRGTPSVRVGPVPRCRSRGSPRGTQPEGRRAACPGEARAPGCPGTSHCPVCSSGPWGRGHAEQRRSRQRLSTPSAPPALASPPCTPSSRTPRRPQETAGSPRSCTEPRPARPARGDSGHTRLLTRAAAVGVTRKLGGVGDGPLCFPGEDGERSVKDKNTGTSSPKEAPSSPRPLQTQPREAGPRSRQVPER